MDTKINKIEKRHDIGRLMFAPDPKTKGYIENTGLFKYLALKKVTKEDFEPYVETIKDEPDKFFKFVNYMGMQSNIEISDLKEWVNHTKDTVKVMADCVGYVFQSEAEKDLISYGLAFKTFAFFGDYTGIEKSITNEDLYQILNLNINTDLRIYSMYYFIIPMVEGMRLQESRNPHLYLRSIKIAMEIEEKFNSIQNKIIHLDDRGHLVK